jgi:RecJ-like exonuclease
MENKQNEQANCGCPFCEDKGETETPMFCAPCAVKSFTCPSCGKPVPRRRKTCPSCGAKIAQPAKA